MADLQSAIKTLGAVEVAPRRYAFKTSHPQKGLRWNAIDAQGLEAFTAGEPTHLISTPLPFWWTPERRYAWRIQGTDGTRYETQETRGEGPSHPAFITADLTTGEEVSA